ncbi:MAG: amino acid adenylation domain-containing protein [Chloroflexi bacterium]|uniref:Amino acid adenylation domain-containing protein n=1 Tax=Candidatus Chlorohelix allophototropha TaxID=3003348 RepID=A0A8T7M6J7_9CHLR|nr:amino acid adenylation domain-containing protein [Chloroflexota bacterium]WJW69643.1 amino acid adenylation domain-containing protein [Chloroflexota bacterium L227-S17]
MTTISDETNNSGGVIPVTGKADTVYFPLSYGQKSLLFLHQLEPESADYNIARAFRIHGLLDVNTLYKALNILTERYPILTAVFGENHGKPSMRYTGWHESIFQQIATTGWSQFAIQERLRVEAIRPFLLTQGVPVRCLLFSSNPEEHIFLFVLHHIVSDFHSLELLFRELWALYEGLSLGQALSSKKTSADYAAFTDWQNNLLQGADGDKLWEYWQNQLEGELPSLNFIRKESGSPDNSINCSFWLDEVLSASLKNLSRRNNTTLFQTVLAAYNILLFRYFEQNDCVVAVPFTSRNMRAYRNTIGYLVNTLPLRTYLSCSDTFLNVLEKVKEQAQGAFSHREYPFPLLVEKLQPERLGAKVSLFQAMFSWQKIRGKDGDFLTAMALNLEGVKLHSNSLVLETLDVGYKPAQLELTLEMGEVAGRLRANLISRSGLFDKANLESMLKHFSCLLKEICANPDKPISRLAMFPPEMRRIILEDWNATLQPFPVDTCIHQCFEVQATKTPNSPAILFNNQTISYKTLNQQANRIAQMLRQVGVKTESRVGVSLERTPLMVAALLGILKAGVAYVPLDPHYPADRLAFMIEDCGVEVLLGQPTCVIPSSVLVLELGNVLADVELEDIPPLTSKVSSQNLAYVLYTSGSTGVPKGVAITHRNAIALLDWASRIYDDLQLKGLLASTSLSFDLSVFELFLPLITGGTVVLVENALSLAEIEEATANTITLVNTVPSVLKELLRLGKLPESVRTVNLAGEPLSAALVQQLYSNNSIQKVYNLYGPTEDTTYSTFALIPADDSKKPPIGKPIANSCGYILDRNLEPVPPGVAGELYLGGEGLARGYINRPALTAERFIPNSFSQQAGSRLYRTGDLCRYRQDGTIEFLGRKDSQVKIRGFRIEPGEIEAVLAGYPAVRECAVIVANGNNGGKNLVAWVAPNAEKTVQAEELRKYLAQILPDYMIPGAFGIISALPRTPGGKLDRLRLSSNLPESVAENKVPNAPITPTEMAIAQYWAEILGLKEVGINDNFFEQGGHSLLATQLIAHLREHYHMEIPLRSIFDHPTISSLAIYLDLLGANSIVEADFELLLAQLEQMPDEEVQKRLAEYEV